MATVALPGGANKGQLAVRPSLPLNKAEHATARPYRVLPRTRSHPLSVPINFVLMSHAVQRINNGSIWKVIAKITELYPHYVPLPINKTTVIITNVLT